MPGPVVCFETEAVLDKQGHRIDQAYIDRDIREAHSDDCTCPAHPYAEGT